LVHILDTAKPGLPYLLSVPYLPIGVSGPRKGWKLSECAYIGTNLTINLVSMLHSGEMVGLLAQLPSWRPRRFGGADGLEEEIDPAGGFHGIRSRT